MTAAAIKTSASQITGDGSLAGNISQSVGFVCAGFDRRQRGEGALTSEGKPRAESGDEADGDKSTAFQSEKQDRHCCCC